MHVFSLQEPIRQRRIIRFKSSAAVDSLKMASRLVSPARGHSLPSCRRGLPRANEVSRVVGVTGFEPVPLRPPAVRAT